MKNEWLLIVYMCLGLYSFYILETMRSYFRIVNLNRTYSKINVYNSVILLLLTVCLTLLFKNYGYITALILAPLLTFFLFRKKSLIYNLVTRLRFLKKNIGDMEYIQVLVQLLTRLFSLLLLCF